MKLNELAAATGVPVSSVKYYLRENLVPPGEKLNATTARYDRRHVDRLELIRDLRTVLGMPLDRVREAVTAVEELPPGPMSGRIQTLALGLAAEAGSGPAARPTDDDEPCGPDGDHAAGAPVQTPPRPAPGALDTAAVAEKMGWLPGTPESIAALDETLRAMDDYDLNLDAEGVMVYARAADMVAEEQISRSPVFGSGAADHTGSDAHDGSEPDRLARYVALGVHYSSRLMLQLLSVAQAGRVRAREQADPTLPPGTPGRPSGTSGPSL